MKGWFWGLLLLLSAGIVMSIGHILLKLLVLLLATLVGLLLLYFWVTSTLTMRQNGFSVFQSVFLPMLTVLTGMGIGFAVLFAYHGSGTHSLLLMGGSSLCAIGMTAYPQLQYRRRLAAYRSKGSKLIQP